MKQKWVKRIARAMLPCFLFFVFSFSFAPKAYAVSWEGTMSYGIYWTYTGGGYPPEFRAGNGALPVINGSVSTAGGSSLLANGRQDARFSFGQTTNFTGPVKLYASYYFVDSITNSSALKTASYSDRFWEKDAWKVSYTNSYGQISEVLGGVDVFDSTPSQSVSAINGKTFILEASWQGSEGLPITSLNVVRDIGSPAGTSGGQQYAYPNAQGLYVTSRHWNPVINFPSVRVITTTTSEEMESLDNIASEIAAQSELLLAMKGDIVAILQDIYAMTGDIHISQNLLNTYVLEMLELLQDIDRTTTNVYSLLSTQLQALETAINNAATTIEAAIAAQTAAMIAYLESVLNTGNEVPDDTYQQQQDATNILDQMESLEKPNVDTIVPEIGDYSDSGVSGVLSAIFSSNLIVTMMTLSASFAFGAYVLFGKRE